MPPKNPVFFLPPVILPLPLCVSLSPPHSPLLLSLKCVVASSQVFALLLRLCFLAQPPTEPFLASFLQIGPLTYRTNLHIFMKLGIRLVQHFYIRERGAHTLPPPLSRENAVKGRCKVDPTLLCPRVVCCSPGRGGGAAGLVPSSPPPPSSVIGRQSASYLSGSSRSASGGLQLLFHSLVAC